MSNHNCTKENVQSEIPFIGSFNRVFVFLSKKAKLSYNIMSKKLTEKLYRAIEYRDIQLLTSVLKNKNCPVNNLSKENEVTRKTPLHMACYLAFEDAVRLLISQKDIDVNCTDCNNWTPLHFAINSRNLNIVLQLLKHKDININIVTKDKTSILHYLCRTIFPDEWDSIYKSIINLICERGIDINANDKNKETPLHQAVAKSNKTSVEILLKLKAELNLRNSFVFIHFIIFILFKYIYSK